MSALLPSVMPWYAAALSLIFVVLSLRVIRGRGLHEVNLGSGGVDDMERRIRAHGNFAEYVPLTLVLIMIDEMRGLPPLAVHALCRCLLFGRLSHAWGVSRREHHAAFRVGGMAGTLTALALAALMVPLTALL